MNALTKFLAMIGISSERYEKMSESEQTQIQGIADGVEASEAALLKAQGDLAAATTQLTEIKAQLADATALAESHEATIATQLDTIATHEKTISTHATTISTQEATITELRAELDNTPGAGEATVVKGAETIPGEKKRKKRSWEV